MKACLVATFFLVTAIAAAVSAISISPPGNSGSAYSKSSSVYSSPSIDSSGNLPPTTWHTGGVSGIPLPPTGASCYSVASTIPLPGTAGSFIGAVGLVVNQGTGTNGIGITTSTNGVTWTDVSPSIIQTTYPITSVSVACSPNICVLAYANAISQIYTMSTTNGGTTWTTPALVNVQTSFSSFQPDFSIRISGNSQGIFVLTMAEPHYAWVALSSNGGATWTSTYPVFPSIGNFRLGSQPANVGVSGNSYPVLMAVATGTTQPTKAAVLAVSRSTTFVGNWSTPMSLTAASPGLYYQNPSIAAGAPGEWMVVAMLTNTTTQLSQIVYTYSRDNGMTWTPVVSIDGQSTYTADRPSLVYIHPAPGVPGYFACTALVGSPMGSGGSSPSSSPLVPSGIYFTQIFGLSSWTPPVRVAASFFPSSSAYQSFFNEVVIARGLTNQIVVQWLGGNPVSIMNAVGSTSFPQTVCQTYTACGECTAATHCSWCPGTTQNTIMAGVTAQCMETSQTQVMVATCSAEWMTGTCATSSTPSTGYSGVNPNPTTTSGSGSSNPTPRKHKSKLWILAVVVVLLVVIVGAGFAAFQVGYKATDIPVIGSLFGSGHTLLDESPTVSTSAGSKKSTYGSLSAI